MTHANHSSFYEVDLVALSFAYWLPDRQRAIMKCNLTKNLKKPAILEYTPIKTLKSLQFDGLGGWGAPDPPGPPPDPPRGPRTNGILNWFKMSVFFGAFFGLFFSGLTAAPKKKGVF